MTGETEGGGGSVTAASPETSRPSIAQSMAAVRFRADPDALQSLLLPGPLSSVEDGDVAWAVVVDTIMPRARQAVDGPPPRETEFREVAVGMPCRWEDRTYLVNPYILIDRPTPGFERGISRGIADVAIERWHPACKGRTEPAAGQHLAASASHHGDAILDLTLTFDRRVGRGALPAYFFEYVHYRRLPDPTIDDGPDLVHDLAAMEMANLDVGAVWECTPTCRFGDWLDGRFADLAVEPLEGYHVAFAYDYVRDRFLASVDPGAGVPR